jgi:hypothetical protein
MDGVGVKPNQKLDQVLIDGKVVTLYVTLNLNRIKQRPMKKKRNLQ